MIEAHTAVPLPERSPVLDAAISAYVKRCKLLLKDAFRRNLDERRNFKSWVEGRFAASADPWMLLHDDPLYTVARFLSIPPHDIHAEIKARAAKIARDHGW